MDEMSDTFFLKKKCSHPYDAEVIPGHHYIRYLQFSMDLPFILS